MLPQLRLGLWLWLGSDPWARNSICLRAAKTNKQTNNWFPWKILHHIPSSNLESSYWEQTSPKVHLKQDTSTIKASFIPPDMLSLSPLQAVSPSTPQPCPRTWNLHQSALIPGNKWNSLSLTALRTNTPNIVLPSHLVISITYSLSHHPPPESTMATLKAWISPHTRL